MCTHYWSPDSFSLLFKTSSTTELPSVSVGILFLAYRPLWAPLYKQGHRSSDCCNFAFVVRLQLLLLLVAAATACGGCCCLTLILVLLLLVSAVCCYCYCCCCCCCYCYRNLRVSGGSHVILYIKMKLIVLVLCSLILLVRSCQPPDCDHPDCGTCGTHTVHKLASSWSECWKLLHSWNFAANACCSIDFHFGMSSVSLRQ